MSNLQETNVFLPTKEEIEQFENFNIDIESEYMLAFKEEMHERLKKIKGGDNDGMAQDERGTNDDRSDSIFGPKE